MTINYKHSFLKNLVMSWGGILVNLISAFLLSPFIIKNIGNSDYGFWSICMSVVGYLGIVDLGVRVTTGRYINYYVGKDDKDKLYKIVNTSLFFYTVISLLLLFVCVIIGINFGLIFPKLKSNYNQIAYNVLLVLSLNIWMNFYSSVFSQLILAKERFDIVNYVFVVNVIVRSLTVVISLKLGYGIYGLVFSNFISELISLLLYYVISITHGVRIEYSKYHVSLSSFKETFAFSSWAFLLILGDKLNVYVNVLLVAVFFSSEEVAYYAVATMLTDYAFTFLSNISNVVMPRIAQKVARGDSNDVINIVISNSNYTMVVSVLVLFGYIGYGQQFISLWMDDNIASKAIKVLILLSISKLFSLNNRAGWSAVWSMGHIKPLAILKITCSIIGIFITLIVSMNFSLGIVSMSIGVLVASIIEDVIIMPFLLSKYLIISMLSYVNSTFVRAFAYSIIMCLTLLLVKNSITNQNVYAFIISVVACTISYSSITYVLKFKFKYI